MALYWCIRTAVLRSTFIHTKTTQNFDVSLDKFNPERNYNEEVVKGNNNSIATTKYGSVWLRAYHLRLGLPRIIFKANEIVSPAIK
jgi:hypothetical protein